MNPQKLNFLAIKKTTSYALVFFFDIPIKGPATAIRTRSIRHLQQETLDESYGAIIY